jgi:hypothetical protein
MSGRLVRQKLRPFSRHSPTFTALCFSRAASAFRRFSLWSAFVSHVSCPFIGRNPLVNTGLCFTFSQSCSMIPFSTEHLTSSAPRGTSSASYAVIALTHVSSPAAAALMRDTRWKTSVMQWLRPCPRSAFC